MARPRKRLPPGARDMLMRMAGDGIREGKAAEALGLSLREFRRLIEENEDARDLWGDCLSVERDRLLDAVFTRATEGDVNAARLLLAIPGTV